MMYILRLILELLKEGGNCLQCSHSVNFGYRRYNFSDHVDCHTKAIHVISCPMIDVNQGLGITKTQNAILQFLEKCKVQLGEKERETAFQTLETKEIRRSVLIVVDAKERELLLAYAFVQLNIHEKNLQRYLDLELGSMCVFTLKIVIRVEYEDNVEVLRKEENFGTEDLHGMIRNWSIVHDWRGLEYNMDARLEVRKCKGDSTSVVPQTLYTHITRLRPQL
ncbi:hypothetical protein Tco_0552870 [Tanacetum coccineum]